MERRIAVLAVCVLLGAAASVLVAWACAAWSVPLPVGVWLPADEPGRARLFAAVVGAPLAAAGPQPEEISTGFGVQWTALDADPAVVAPLGSAARYIHVLAGWPATAFEGAIDLPPNTPLISFGGFSSGTMNGIPAPTLAAPPAPVAVHRGIVVSGGPGTPFVTAAGSPRDRLLPLCPVWNGLVIDALFYGAIIGLLVPGPVMFRRLVRALRGRCMWCAYPRGTSAVCTECGRPVAVSRGLPLVKEAFWSLVATPVPRRAVAWTLLLLAALVPGTIINVAVAWGCATASGTRPRQSTILPDQPDRAWWRRHAPLGTPEAAPLSAACAPLGPGKSWSTMWQPPGRYVVRIRAGWPMSSMERDWWEAEVDVRYGSVGGLLKGSYSLSRAALPAPRLLPGVSDTVVPTRPVFPGFLVNTLFYALPFLGIQWGAMLQRALRRR